MIIWQYYCNNKNNSNHNTIRTLTKNKKKIIMITTIEIKNYILTKTVL